MSLPSKNFSQLVADLQLAWQNAIGIIPAVQVGDMLYAIIQSFASQLLFLQAQAQIVNAIARAQTSSGGDLDTFMAQFAFPRLNASSLTGPELFSRLTASSTQVLVRPGVLVQTPGSAIQYQVIPDATQPTWSGALQAYVLAPGQTSLTATVQALLPGTAYAVTAGQLSQLASALPGIDTVTNPSAISSASPPETDDAYRARFVLYLGSLSKATKQAILYAINTIQTGLSTNLLENEDPSGDTLLGAFTAVVDDGSGSPSADLLNQIFQAVDAVRGFTIQPFVVGPTVVHPAIVLNIRVANGFDVPTAETNVRNAVHQYVNSLEAGARWLYVSSIEEAAIGATGCVAVQPGATTIAGVNADYALTAFQIPRISGGNPAIGTY